ncbi:MAG: hypothetical protein ACRC1K_14990, partial [Planctomycetia bacterium]
MIHFLLHFALIYTKAQLTVENPRFASFLNQYLVTGDGAAYRDFLRFQARGVVVLLLAYCGIVLVASDHRAGGVGFYLSKPVSPYDYILGKTLALWTIVSFLTLLPALVLFAEYGLFSDSLKYWFDNLHIVKGIVALSLVFMTLPSLFLLAVGTLFRRGASLVMIWLGLFLVVPAMSELMRQVFQVRAWRLLNLWYGMNLMGDFFFGATMNDEQQVDLWWSVGLFALMAAASVWILRRRLHAVEVVE